MNDAPERMVRTPRWSVTVWLILICTAVFVIDGFITPLLPAQWIYMSVQQKSELPTSGGSLRATKIEPVPLRAANGQLVRPSNGSGEGTQRVVLSEGGNQIVVAEREYIGISFLQRWLYFSTSTALVTWSNEWGLRGFEFWRFIGFQFCHANLGHLLFNMISLWFFGPIVEHALGRKRFLAFYLTCGIAGALMYLLLNAAGTAATSAFGPGVHLPGFLLNNPNLPLVGASAGIFGVLIAAARYVPNATVLLFFIIPIRLSTLAYGLVGVAAATVIFAGLGKNIPIFSLPTDNAGGEAAHLGGAIAGWFFARQPHHLSDFFDFLGRFDPTSMFHKARRMKKGVVSNVEIDRILDKIRARGLGSLTPQERQTLRNASER